MSNFLESKKHLGNLFSLGSSLLPLLILPLYPLRMFASTLTPPLALLFLLTLAKGCSCVQGHCHHVSSCADLRRLYDLGQRLSPWRLTSQWEVTRIHGCTV